MRLDWRLDMYGSERLTVEVLNHVVEGDFIASAVRQGLMQVAFEAIVGRLNPAAVLWVHLVHIRFQCVQVDGLA